MRKVILWIASSIDGYIARTDGGVDWLFFDQDYGYREFYEGIDTTIMGYKTYEAILNYGDFPYADKVNYVLSTSERETNGNPVTFVHVDAAFFVAELKKQQGKDIWLIGGSEINTLLHNFHLIDEMVLSIHPIILGEGIPLFTKTSHERMLKLKRHKAFNTGLVQLHYNAYP